MAQTRNRAAPVTPSAPDANPGGHRAPARRRSRRLPAEQERVPYLGFFLGTEVYGLPLEQLREVARLTRLRRVPGAPPGVAGLVNLRGEIICALEVRTILGLGRARPDESSILVALRGFADPLGLVVDSIADIYSIDPASDRVAAGDVACRTRRVFCRHRPRAGRTDGAARSQSAREDMKGASPRERHGDPVEELDSSAVVTLLLFEAADCLMALPASEVARLLAPGSQLPSADEGGASVAWIDLDEYFSGRRSEGPWLRWDRGNGARGFEWAASWRCLPARFRRWRRCRRVSARRDAAEPSGVRVFAATKCSC